MSPPPSLRATTMVPLANPCPPASLDLTLRTARCAAASFSTVSTVPVKVIDIAPILTRIWALIASSPVRSVTVAPSTHGTTRSRSVMMAKLSSMGLAVEKVWSSSTAMWVALRGVVGGQADPANTKLRAEPVSQFFNTNPAGLSSGARDGTWSRTLPRTWRAALDLPEPLREVAAPLPPGTYRLGPDDGTLSLRTTRSGAAAKAGHDLLIHVTSWEATLEVGPEPAEASIALDADGGSLRVREGSGGAQELGDDDKANIEKTIDDEILRRERVSFRSTGAAPGPDGSLTVQGAVTLMGTSQPVDIELRPAGDGAVVATAVVTQSGWGMKPYSILFGSLKVVDEVGVRLEATLPQSR